jgi:hypothetical protein
MKLAKFISSHGKDASDGGPPKVRPFYIYQIAHVLTDKMNRCGSGELMESNAVNCSKGHIPTL